jgi:hypothetical protein
MAQQILLGAGRLGNGCDWLERARQGKGEKVEE